MQPFKASYRDEYEDAKNLLKKEISYSRDEHFFNIYFFNFKNITNNFTNE